MHVPVFVWLLAALVLVRFAIRPLIALIRGNAIGAAVVARQPDEIHLEPSDESAARRTSDIAFAVVTLQREGFFDAGWFTVPELPDFTLRMLVHEPEGLLATIYDHQRSGQVWVEVGMRFPDGNRLSYNNRPASGLAPLPGVEVRHMAGAPVETLLRAVRAGRLKRPVPPLPVSVTQAPRIFEEGYALLVAARKRQGISRAEVVAVAMRPPIDRGRPRKAA
jgi:hypothetical protein